MSQETAPQFPFHTVEVSGADALQSWKYFQQLWRKEGCSAVVIGDPDDAANLAQNREFNTASPRETLEVATRIDVPEFFKDRVLAEEDYYNVEEGNWPLELAAPIEFTSHLDLGTRKPKSKVLIAQIPTERSYEIPAYLAWGGWNECPGPAEQVAVLRHWHEKYGIEIFAITGDVLECSVDHPPMGREECIELAREQFIYCTDIVYQGVETLFALAALLQNSHAWFFWWD